MGIAGTARLRRIADKDALRALQELKHPPLFEEADLATDFWVKGPAGLPNHAKFGQFAKGITKALANASDSMLGTKDVVEVKESLRFAHHPHIVLAIRIRFIVCYAYIGFEPQSPSKRGGDFRPEKLAWEREQSFVKFAWVWKILNFSEP